MKTILSLALLAVVSVNAGRRSTTAAPTRTTTTTTRPPSRTTTTRAPAAPCSTSDCGDCLADPECSWDQIGGACAVTRTASTDGTDYTRDPDLCPASGSCRFRCGVVGDARFDSNTDAVAWRGGPFWGGRGGWFGAYGRTPQVSAAFNPFFRSEEDIIEDDDESEKQFFGRRWGGGVWNNFVRPPVAVATVADKPVCSCDQSCDRMGDCCNDYHDFCTPPRVVGPADPINPDAYWNKIPGAPIRNMCRWRCNCAWKNGGATNGNRCGFYDIQCNSCN